MDESWAFIDAKERRLYVLNICVRICDEMNCLCKE